MIARVIDQHHLEICDLSQFDSQAILQSGQVFRYTKLDQGWRVLAGNHWAILNDIKDKVLIACDDANFFYQYFDLDTDYRQIKAAIRLPKLQNALSLSGGIRILRACFVEVVISFIISANNNIKRFTKTINALCEEYGTLMKEECWAFPTLEQLRVITLNDFARLGCGYRAPYLVKTIQQLSTFNYEELQKMATPDLRKRLLSLAGVGPKVADCILLFAFHRLEVVPIDTWIKKALAQLSESERAEIFQSPYAGVIQQYMFYYLQHLRREVL